MHFWTELTLKHISVFCTFKFERNVCQSQQSNPPLKKARGDTNKTRCNGGGGRKLELKKNKKLLMKLREIISQKVLLFEKF